MLVAGWRHGNVPAWRWSNTGFGNEKNFVDELVSRFKPRAAGMHKFALRQRVVLLSDGTIPFDIALGGLDF